MGSQRARTAPRRRHRLGRADRLLLTGVLVALASAAVGTGATAASVARRAHARVGAATPPPGLARSTAPAHADAYFDGVMDAEILVVVGTPIRPGDDCQLLTGRRAGALFSGCAAGERDLARELAH
ncbi:MAG TPA: hypothetical protein VMU75_13840 [Acidimicrobiales bacterium]|nr:hypothetical protein [Acidimicrobiales bacterium]